MIGVLMAAIVAVAVLPTWEARGVLAFVCIGAWSALYVLGAALWLWDNKARVRLRNPLYLQPVEPTQEEVVITEEAKALDDLGTWYSASEEARLKRERQQAAKVRRMKRDQEQGWQTNHN